jgi:predicted ATPase
VSDQFSTEGVDSSLLSQLARHSNVKYGFEPTRCIEEATTEIKTTTEGWSEAEASRIACEIKLIAPEPGCRKSQKSYFKRALVVARQQQAKSWELRAATSMARLWRDQGERKEVATFSLGSMTGFSEWFDTRDLKEAGVARRLGLAARRPVSL